MGVRTSSTPSTARPATPSPPPPAAVAAPDPGTVLAAAARASLRLPDPIVATSPPASTWQVVGFATWLWVDPATYRPRSATASIPGLSATVTATPVGLAFDPGDGSAPLTCTGPGLAYVPGITPVDDLRACAHAWQAPGPFTLRATTTWHLTWTATDGEHGTLPATTTTAAITVQVEAIQAVLH